MGKWKKTFWEEEVAKGKRLSECSEGSHEGSSESWDGEKKGGQRSTVGQWSVVTDGKAERAGETRKEAQGGEGEGTFKNDTTSVPPKVPVNYKLQVTRYCIFYGTGTLTGLPAMAINWGQHGKKHRAPKGGKEKGPRGGMGGSNGYTNGRD